MAKNLFDFKSKAEASGAGLDTLQQKAKLASLQADELGLKAKAAADGAAQLEAKGRQAGQSAEAFASKVQLAHNQADQLAIKAGLAADGAAAMGREAEGAASGGLSSLAEVAGGAAALGVAALAAGVLAVGAALVASVPPAAQFEASTERLHTQAGMLQSDVAQVRQRLLEMAPALGTSPEALSEGFYHIASAVSQLPPALRNVNDELAIYTNAVKLSKIGNADLEDSTQAMIGAMAAYAKQGMTAADAAAQLNAVVGAGDMKMQQLTSAMATGILPAAATFGLKLTDVGAALATLTDNVTPADEAATRLRMTFSMLGAPTGAAQKALSAIGINATQLGYDMRKPDGLLVALGDLHDHLTHIDASQLKGGLGAAKAEMEKLGFTTDQVDKMVGKLGPDATEQAVILARAFGGGRSSAAIMTLLTEFDSFKDKYKAISAGAKDFEDDWTATTRTVQFQWQQFTAGIEASAVKIGFLLLPATNTVLTGLNNLLTAANKRVGDWVGNLQTILGSIGGAISSATTPMQPGETRMVTGGQRALGPVYDFLRGYTAATAPPVFASGSPGTRTQVATPVPQSAAGQAGVGFAEALQAASRIVQQILGSMSAWWKQHGDQVMSILRTLRATVVSSYQEALAGLKAQLGPALATLQGWWKEHGDQVVLVVTTMWNLAGAVFERALPLIETIVRFSFQGIKDLIGGVLTLIVDIIRIFWDIVSGIFALALDVLTGRWGRFGNDLRKLTTDTYGDLARLVGDFFHTLFNLFGDAAGMLGNLAAQIGDQIHVNIRGGLNMAINAFDDFIRSVNGLLGNFGLSLPLIPGIEGGGGVRLRLGSGGQGGMAEGGLVTGPTAIVAEGGYPEWVIPTDPSKRSRALALLTAAGASLMAEGGVFGGLFSGMLSGPEHVARSAAGALGGLSGAVAGGILDMVVRAMPGWIGSHMPQIGGVSGDVQGWIMAAIGLTGVPLSWANGLAIIIQHESGGNPGAANLWDVNALAGNPSVGLMQLTLSNQAAYGGVTSDPVMQIIEGIRYIKDRYGDISSVPGVASVLAGGPYLPYDSGGYLPPGLTLAYNGTGRPERVLPPGAEGVSETNDLLGGIYKEVRGLRGDLQRAPFNTTAYGRA